MTGPSSRAPLLLVLVWLGGLLAESLAGYRLMWLVDVGLALLAAALNLPLRRPSLGLAPIPALAVRAA